MTATVLWLPSEGEKRKQKKKPFQRNFYLDNHQSDRERLQKKLRSYSSMKTAKVHPKVICRRVTLKEVRLHCDIMGKRSCM